MNPNVLLRSVIGLVTVIVFGTLGYMFIEQWSFLDGLYMTVITISSIGYGEVHRLSDTGRVFTLVLILIGFGVVGYVLVTASKLLIEGEVQKILTRRRSMKAIEKIKDHFVVCGFGRMGAFVCQQFHARGIPFVVVENDPETQLRIMETGYFLSPGDATQESVLLGANIKSARGLVSVLNSDAANVYVVLTARELHSSLEIFARAGEEGAQKKLLRAGANRVISPYQVGGMRMVMAILKPEVMNFLEVAMDYRDLNIEIEGIKVADGSAYAGKSLIDTDIRKDLNLIVIAVKKPNGKMVFNPGPQTVIEENDTLIAMGEKKSLETLEKKSGLSTSWEL
ncbi:MAG: potassium channel protein [Deltaproteobacteria bacterium]|nr:potassium channel protein [Deltaproteobacteria bacterium]